MRKLIIAVIGLMLLASCSKSDSTAAGAGRERVVPIVAAPVQRRDMPLYLDGLGTVIANATVTVRTLVDGTLTAVNFKEGQEIRKGGSIAQVDPRPFAAALEQAEGQLARDEAQLENNRRIQTRDDELEKEKLLDPQDAETQRALVAQFEGAVRQDRGLVSAARLNLEYSRLTAPFDGVAGIRNIDVGNIVHVADANGLVTLTQLDPIAVIFTLPQDSLASIAKARGQGELTVVVFSGDGKTELGRGKLAVIDNLINVATATLRLKAVLANSGHALWPNQFVKARLMLTVRPDALVIPAQAIQRGQEGSYVYVVGEDQTAQVRPVVVELLQGDDALLTSGVQPGDTVVVEGQNQLRPGSKISQRTPGAEGRSAGVGAEASKAAGEFGHGKRPPAGAGGGAAEPPAAAPPGAPAEGTPGAGEKP